MQVRDAQQGDAAAMAAILNAIIAAGGTTALAGRFDGARIASQFTEAPRRISCVVAMDDGTLRGFQALEWCDPDWPGPDPLPPDWAIVSTYVDPGSHRMGVGRTMFASTREAAVRAGVRVIDATIRAENVGGQAFYEGIGFTTYRLGEGIVAKRLRTGA